MSTEEQLARIAAALEEIKRLLEGCNRELSFVRKTDAIPEGHLLNKDGIVSDERGDFMKPVGEIDLNRIGAAPGVPARVWTILVRWDTRRRDPSDTTQWPTSNVISVKALMTFWIEVDPDSVRSFGKKCRALVEDWIEQLDQLPIGE